MVKPNQMIEHYYAPFNALLFSKNTTSQYLSPNLLYTIKTSHMAWELKNGKWWKHLKDLVFMKSKGCSIDQEVFDACYKHWETLHGNKSHISLNKATEMFFKDGVRREFDHDYLHDYFKITEKPAYQYILTTDDSPLCSYEKFCELDTQLQYYTCLEEMFVVSCERNISLPNAYKALVTKMTKGWWNQFMIDNAEILLDGFEYEKLTYLKRKLTL
jgi:hypothetical protein